VIIVGRLRRNRRDVAQRLHETLTGAGAPLLGVVANGVKAGRRGSYDYSYDYAYAARAGRAPIAPMSANGASSTASANGGFYSDEPAPHTQSLSVGGLAANRLRVHRRLACVGALR
jgi:Mrp family chromosome partitioning ATPase